MAISLGDQVPNFEADTTQGSINFYQWAGDSWVVLVSHPNQFRPVCATALGELAKLSDEFERRNIKVLIVSCAPMSSFDQWSNDVLDTQGVAIQHPVVIDSSARIATMYGMIHPGMSETVPMRVTMIVSPDKRLRVDMALPSSLGRNFNEILRLCDSLQLTERYDVATPAGWQWGDDVIIVPGMSTEEANKKFPGGWDEQRSYLRVVKQPGESGTSGPRP
ncbi:peroxiredoxin [soil metagenome]